MKKMTLARINLPVVLLFLAVGSICAQEATPINDGPYVVWTGPQKASVLYVCDDSLVVLGYQDRDTLNIRAGHEESDPMLAVPAAPSALEPDSFLNVTKIFAVSDIHGEYEALAQVLKSAGVIDSALHWSWGDGHLVVCGDVCDRGDKVTQAYWMIYRLEQEAAKVGGAVHMLLGNHEHKDMLGQDNDVNEVYTKGIARKSGILHRDLFSTDTELGQWLHTRNTVIKLGGMLFLHGGLSPQMVASGWNLNQINQKVRTYLYNRTTQNRFFEEPQLLFGEFGPLWYRGLFMAREGKYDQLTESEVRQILQKFCALAMVVGHTEHDRDSSYYNGLVWGLDNPVDSPVSMEGLLWQDSHVYRISGSGSREQLK
jgi:hypothetical protein